MPESLFKIKKDSGHRCFPVNFVKFLRTPFLKKEERKKTNGSSRPNLVINNYH